MASNINPIFELIPVNASQTFENADADGVKTIYTVGADGGRIDGIIICSDDTSERNLAFYIDDGVANRYIGNVVVPIGSGYGAVAKVDGMDTLKISGQTFIQMHHGYKLEANAVVAVTAGKIVTVTVIGGDF